MCLLWGFTIKSVGCGSGLCIRKTFFSLLGNLHPPLPLRFECILSKSASPCHSGLSWRPPDSCRFNMLIASHTIVQCSLRPTVYFKFQRVVELEDRDIYRSVVRVAISLKNDVLWQAPLTTLTNSCGPLLVFRPSGPPRNPFDCTRIPLS